MEFTVVIPHYNAADTLELQLQALAGQRNAPSFDVLVVDNGSTTPPTQLIDAWSTSLDVRMISASDVQGVSYARNVGLAHATAENVAFVDADDCAGPEFLAWAAEALADAEFVSGAVLTLSYDEVDAGLEAVWASLEAWNDPYSEPEPIVPVDPDYPIFMGGASAVRRAAARALGGFDQAFVPGAEDNDFGLRAVEAGYRVVRCSEMKLAERRRKTDGASFKRMYEGGRMHMRLCAAHELWEKSPHLSDPVWWQDLLRLPLAAGKIVLTDRSADSRRSLTNRTGLRLGQAVGFAEYRVRRIPIVPRLGVGLDQA